MIRIYFNAAVFFMILGSATVFAQSDADVPSSNVAQEVIADATNEEMLNDEGYGQDDVEYYGAEDDLNAETNVEEDVEPGVDVNAEADQ